MKIKTMIVYSILLVLILIIPETSALAYEYYCVDVHVTDINPSSAELDSEVTVGIQFDNCGSNILPEIVNFEIRRFSEDIKIREPLVIEFDRPFGYANSDRFNVYHLYVTRNATPGEYVFEYRLDYGNKDSQVSKEGNFSITVTSREADLNIAYVKTEPLLPKVGDEVTLTIRLENFGNGDANSVKAKIDLPFFGVKESFLGELESGDDSSLVFTVVPDKSGAIKYNLNVNYKDDFGEHRFNEVLELNIQENKKSTTFLIALFTIAVALIGGAIYYFVFRGPEKIKRSQRISNKKGKE